jgi:putative glutamine amidotransferase
MCEGGDGQKHATPCRYRPRIGVVGNNAAQLKNYVEAVEAAGGEALALTGGEQSPDTILDQLEGLVLTGGKDIDPETYGQTTHADLGVDVDSARDALELPLTRRALDRDLPVLGICRGIQVMNVAAGGTLHQDIVLAGHAQGSHNQREASPRPPDDAGVHEVAITPGSRLAGIVGAVQIGVNTFHHQVIDRLAPQFTVVARSVEPEGAGVIEAVEVRGRAFALGVQWHPERMWKAAPACARLFQALVEAAAGQRAGSRRTPPGSQAGERIITL